MNLPECSLLYSCLVSGRGLGGGPHRYWDSDPIIIKEVTTNWKYLRAAWSACILKTVFQMGCITKEKFTESQLCVPAAGGTEGPVGTDVFLQVAASIPRMVYTIFKFMLARIPEAFISPPTSRLSFNSCVKISLSYLKAVQAVAASMCALHHGSGR